MTAALRPSLGARHRLSVAVLALVHGLTFNDRLLIALLAPAIKPALQLSDFEVGLLQGSAFVATYTSASLALAFRTRELDRFSVLVAGFAVSTLATALSGAATSFLAFFAVRMMMGLGQASVSPMALSLMGEVVPEGRAGRSVSIYTAGAALGRSAALLGGGGLLAYVALPLFGRADAWRGVFLLAILPNLAVVLLLRRSWFPSKPRGGGDDGRASLRVWLRGRWRFALTHVVASGATVLVIQTLTAWAATLLTRRHGLSVAQAGADFGIIVLLAAPLGHLAGGALLDRLARQIAARAAGIAMAAALMGTSVAFATLLIWHSLEATCATLATATFLLGAASPAGLAGVQAVAPQPLRSRTIAIFISLVTAIGFGLGPALLGGLTDGIFGPQGIASALLAMTMAAALCATLAVLLQG